MHSVHPPWASKASLPAAVLFILSMALACPAASARERQTPEGLPFLRVYPYDEVGYATRSARLMFDQYGRVAVVREGSFVVLNDDTWINLIQEILPGMVRIIAGRDQRLYFGSRRIFGRAVFSPSGKLVPELLVPEQAPEWTHPAFFDDIVPTSEGVFFGSWYGVAFLKYKDDSVRFLEVRNENLLIPIGNRVFVATKSGEIFELGREGEDKTLRCATADGRSIERVAEIGDSKALLSTGANRLLLFDGHELKPWTTAPGVLTGGKISCVRQLADGDIGVAELGKGLFIFDPAGRLRHAFTAPRFRQVSDIASNEKGVMWLATEDSVLKVLYDCPMEDFGHDLGLIPYWPVVAEAGGSTYVASDKVVYKLERADSGRNAAFRPLPEQPPGGADAIVGNANDLIVASEQGLYTLKNESFVRIADVAGIAKLAFPAPDLLIAASQEEICAFIFDEGRWTEACPRIPGVGFSPVTHTTPQGMLIELASHGVALVAFDRTSCTLSLEKLKPWPDAEWTSASVLGDLVMMTGKHRQRRFYNLLEKRWVTPEPLDSAIGRSAQWIIRLQKGADGTYWGLTNKSLVAFYPAPDMGGFASDATSFDFINNLYPAANVLPSGALWVTANQALYRVNTAYRPSSDPAPEPSIVSVVETLSNRELWNRRSPSSTEARLLLEQSGVSVRIFSGTYKCRRPPVYEYRMDGRQWLPIDSGSLLSLRKLDEGDHELEIRLQGAGEGTAAPGRLLFSVPPPWYRSGTARVVYLALLGAAFFAGIRLSSRTARRRSERLETLVSERTKQLEKAMEQLNEETRVAATFSERNRIAGEIHDSLQQGLSGAILHLDSTINLPQIDQRVRSRLDVVRNMLSFTRHEVQNAVWDKESPLLGDGELGEALHKLTAFVNSDTSRIQVLVQGEPRALPTEAKHHLMRIAQEATTNAVRHARASSIAVTLAYEPSCIVMRIEDDGVGFDPAAAMDLDQGHFGLRGLQSRARRLGADIDIASNPGAGTRIVVRLKA